MMVSISSQLSVIKVSVSNAEGPPVPIPNTEVKLCSAEDTCLATDRENRSMLTQSTLRNFSVLFILRYVYCDSGDLKKSSVLHFNICAMIGREKISG